ncbi:hypothetical protein [Halorubrum sp. N11]|uniref:hypothetical protein n=1 Tax=Halorubrum sp. N11 TaxID=3402276 RepID=UPI003EBDE5C2
MGQQSLDGHDLTGLRAAYTRKVTEELPKRARQGDSWPIRDDHCFARVVLDAVFQDAWYDHVDGSPAYKQLSAAELREAIAIADRMLASGAPAVSALNRQSLRWREEA